MKRDKEELKLFSLKTLQEILDNRKLDKRFTSYPGGFSSLDIMEELNKRKSK